MRHIIICFLYLMVAGKMAYGQFAPPAGHEGTTAIHMDSALFVAWATGCEVVRGPVNVLFPDGEKASFGEPADATGPAQGNSVNILSLGDGGMATLTFDVAIADGEGFDFAVFENSFSDTFLELAFVEVSSDGEFFVRFPSVSLTDPDTQTGTFGETDCTKIHNLAGKYRQGYGTPFELAELAGIPGLDIQHITHVRVIDVVGIVDTDHASTDSQGNIINDPWPTPFSSGGFDLDGVGVINTSGTGINENKQLFSVFPNPFNDRFQVISCSARPFIARVINSSGRLIIEKSFAEETIFDLTGQPVGLYMLMIECEDKRQMIKVLKVP
jgi:hypothetical protein